MAESRSTAQWIIAALFVVVLGVPLVLSRRMGASPEASGDLPAIIVVTPHVQQIREEFARAFDSWHREHYGSGVRIDYRTIGGTSEIIRALKARYQAAIAENKYTFDAQGQVVMQPGAVDFDLMFGGGSYDHGRLKKGISVHVGETLDKPNTDKAAIDDKGNLRVPMSEPAGFSQEQLDAWFGENAIGAGRLYEPEQYWLGTALSGFGIVFNRDLTRQLLGRDNLDSFEDLTDPRLEDWVALADPRQSGSITTTIDSILSNYGWEKGWRTLRAISGNTRYFTNSSTKPPIDVSQGEAAAGLAIDFYGRTQSQIVMKPGQTPETCRVGYIDPPGEVSIDADPVSVLRGGPHPELARHFVEFVLSDAGQALWDFHARDLNPSDADELPHGPVRFELRRMPIRRDFYSRFGDRLIDKVNPYELASPTAPAGWRSAIGMMMGAFAVDTHEKIRRAWRALDRAEHDGVDAAVLDRAQAIFYAFPTPEQVQRHWESLFGKGEPTLPEGAKLAFTPENYRTIRNTWRDPTIKSRLAVVYAQAFSENYDHVTHMLSTAGVVRDDAHNHD